MTNESQVPALWTPNTFDKGTDLLPVHAAGSRSTRGQENVRSEDLVLPVIKLLQGMSPEVTEQTVEGAVPGAFLHTGVQEVFKGPLRVLVCAHTRSRALFPNDKDDDYDGLEQCLSRDGKEGSTYGSCDACHHTEWRPDRKPPLCSEAHNFTVLTSYGPAILRFSKRSMPSARNFLTTWTMSGKDIWMHPAVISTKQHVDVVDQRGTKATNYSLEIRWQAREDVPPAAQQAALSIYETVSSANDAGKFGGNDEGASDIPF